MYEPHENTAADSAIPKPNRLKEQGFMSLRRKPVFSILASLVLVYLIWVPDMLPMADSCVWICQIVGGVMVFLGIIGRVFSTLSIGGRKDREIVTTELYSICRNPLYFASFLMTIGIGLLMARIDFLLLVALTYLAIFYPMMHNEARFLRARFREYAEYEGQVPLFFPRFSLWYERRHFQIDFKLVRRTLLEAMIGLPIVVLILVIRAFTH